MNIPLKVDAVIADPNTEAQIVILKDEQNLDLLSIWVGMAEGNAIRLALEGIASPRPLSHDLLKDFLHHLKVPLEKILIHSMSGGTYYASLHLIQKKSKQTESTEPSEETLPNLMIEEPEEITVDARPSDAIALALRMGVPIYATEDVLHKKGPENLDSWLEKLKPTDFGPFDA